MAKEVNKFAIWKGLILCLWDTGWPPHQWTQWRKITGYSKEATPNYNMNSKNSSPSKGQQKWLLQRGVDKHGIKLAARQNVLELISYLEQVWSFRKVKPYWKKVWKIWRESYWLLTAKASVPSPSLTISMSSWTGSTVTSSTVWGWNTKTQ